MSSGLCSGCARRTHLRSPLCACRSTSTARASPPPPYPKSSLFNRFAAYSALQIRGAARCTEQAQRGVLEANAAARKGRMQYERGEWKGHRHVQHYAELARRYHPSQIRSDVKQLHLPKISALIPPPAGCATDDYHARRETLAALESVLPKTNL